MNKTLLASALLLTAFSAHAVDAPQWKQVSIGFVAADIDGVDDDLTGAAIAGSFLLNDNIFLAARAESTDTDIRVNGRNVNAEINRSNIGIGYRHGVTSSTDVYGKLSAENYEVKATASNISASQDANGGSFELGLRSLVTTNVELGASATFIRLSDDGESDSDTIVSAFGAYHFNDKFSLALGYSTMDDADFTELKGTLSF
jgi:hypothetical protein